jgi:hypothetical protein
VAQEVLALAAIAALVGLLVWDATRRPATEAADGDE